MTTGYHDDKSVVGRRSEGMLFPRVGPAIAAAIIAGVVFAMMEMILVAVVMGKPWYGPLHMIAAIGMGPAVLPPPPAFDIGVALVAISIHMLVSIVYAFILAMILLALRTSHAWWVGLVFGIALYYINFYAFTGMFPWFAEARGWIGFVSHAVYGVVLALVYRGMDKREKIHVSKAPVT